MTKPLDRHQGNQVILAVRAWFLEAVRTWCPEVLEDLRRTVYVPSGGQGRARRRRQCSCDPPCPSIVKLKPGFSGGPDDGG